MIYMKHLLLLSTGGTIASKPTENGLAPSADAQAILSYIPQVQQICKITAQEVFNIDSTNLQPEHWLLLAKRIRENYDRYDGFIVTHGTDTMAYTAAALSYLIQNPDKPIVLTGSQKPIFAPITDAKKNLLDSIRFACKDGICGIYIVFDGKAIIGTRARKVRSKSYSAFESINYPVAAFIDDKRILRYVDTEPHPASVTFYDTLHPKVFLLKLVPGIEPHILRYIAEHYDAIVIESYGVGGIPFHDARNFLKELELLSEKGKLVVITTQVMLEGSDAETYEVGAKAIQQYNALQAYDMTVESAVVKLMWIMGQTRDLSEMQQLFYQPVHHDLLI